MSQIQHLALDGGHVKFSSPASVDFSRPYTSVDRWVISGREVEFTAGPLSFGPAFAAEFDIELNQRYTMGTGILGVGLGSHELRDPEFGFHVRTAIAVASWSGRNFSVTTHMPAGTVDDMLARFAHFAIVETPFGVTMHAKSADARRSDTWSTSVLKEVPGLGLLVTERLRPATAAALPSWSGVAVDGGEAYCDKTDGGTPIFRLLGVHELTTVMPDPLELSDGNGEEVLTRMTEALSSLTVSWEPAAER